MARFSPLWIGTVMIPGDGLFRVPSRVIEMTIRRDRLELTRVVVPDVADALTNRPNVRAGCVVIRRRFPVSASSTRQLLQLEGDRSSYGSGRPGAASPVAQESRPRPVVTVTRPDWLRDRAATCRTCSRVSPKRSDRVIPLPRQSKGRHDDASVADVDCCRRTGRVRPNPSPHQRTLGTCEVKVLVRRMGRFSP
jgi:hypothetical protein